MSNNQAKKIIILGGNIETGAIVDIANKMGLYTIVIDPNPNSPSKRNSSKSYDLDVTNLPEIDSIINKENADGVLVGVADPLVPYYEKICNRNNLFCYANEKSIKYLTSKSNFSEICNAFGISVTPTYNVDISNHSEIADLEYPVVVKPVDAGAGVGISICRNPSQLHLGIKTGLAHSIRKELIIEKYMRCDDMFVYYTFIDGEAHLSALADRFKTDKQGEFSSVCIAAEYPSRHTSRFLKEVHPKLSKMFKNLNITNGVLSIQFFVDSTNFYAYDPGFRLQGEAPHLYLKHFNKFDHREMLLNFSIYGKMFDLNFNSFNDFKFNNKYATTIWILLKAGKISRIKGVDVIKSQPNLIYFLQRFEVNDYVTNDMIGTERQVFARIYTTSETQNDSVNLIEFIHKNLSIIDEYGNEMILDNYRKSQK